MTVTEQQLGQRIRIARERFHLTPQELGEFVDLAASTIEAIEQGARRAESRELLRIAFATGRTRSGASVRTLLNTSFMTRNGIAEPSA